MANTDSRIPFYCIPEDLDASMHTAALEGGVDVGRVALGVMKLSRQLYQTKEVDRRFAASVLGGEAVLTHLVNCGALLEHGDKVTTLLTLKQSSTGRLAANSRWDAHRSSPPEKKKKKQRESKRERETHSDACVRMRSHAPASAPADVPVQGLDAGQETDATRPQLTLAPSVIPERNAFREAQEALCAEFASLRAGKYRWQGAKDGAALKGLLEAGATVQELRERWARALQLERWPACATVAELASKWNHLARVEVKHKTGTSNVF